MPKSKPPRKRRTAPARRGAVSPQEVAVAAAEAWDYLALRVGNLRDIDFQYGTQQLVELAAQAGDAALTAAAQQVHTAALRGDREAVEAAAGVFVVECRRRVAT